MAAPAIPHWQALVLHGIGAPVTSANVTFLNAWARAEGGNASNNPFNTTQPHPQATGNYNSVGVKNYANPQAGIQATVQTLLNGRYGNILAALKQGTDARAAASALAASPWGTGSLVEKILGGSPGQVSPPVASPSTPTRNTGIPTPGAPVANSALGELFNTGNRLFGLPSVPASLFPGSARLSQPTGPVRPASSLRAAPPAFLNGSTGGPKAQRVVQIASTMIGTPYQWGGNTPGKALDCSGFLQQAFAKAGVRLPRTSQQQFKVGTPVKLNQLAPGDAVFTEPGKTGPGHVGIYVGGGMVQESPHTGDVNKYIPLQEFLGGGFVGAKRYL